MNLRLLLGGIFFAGIFTVLVFVFRGKIWASDQLWGCSFEPIAVATNSGYIVGYESTNKLVNYTVGFGYTSPTYWYRPAGNTSWFGGFPSYGPKVGFYENGTIKDSINMAATINNTISLPEKTEQAYEWTPAANFSLSEVRFYSSDPGAFKIRVYERLVDDSSGDTIVTPGNVLRECSGGAAVSQPTADPGGPYTGFEGSPIAFDGTGSTDVGGTITSYQWDLSGNGQYTDGSGPNPTHTWLDDYNGTAVLKVTDSNGQTATAAAAIKVANVPPSVIADNSINPTITAGQPIVLTGSFKDPGQDTFTIRWDFGDGLGADGNLTANHTYAQAGSYTATLIVTDDDGGIGSDKVLITVLPPVNAIRATIDFSPETLSLTSSGNWVTVKIQLPAGYDATKIDPSSLVLKGPVVIEASPIGASSLSGVTSTGLVVKFDRQKIQGIVQPGDSVQVNISGKLLDGTIFAGSDIIRVIN